MAYCRKCGAEIDNEAVICPKCGVPQNISAPKAQTQQLNFMIERKIAIFVFIIHLAIRLYYAYLLRDQYNIFDPDNLDFYSFFISIISYLIFDIIILIGLLSPKNNHQICLLGISFMMIRSLIMLGVSLTPIRIFFQLHIFITFIIVLLINLKFEKRQFINILTIIFLIIIAVYTYYDIQNLLDCLQHISSRLPINVLNNTIFPFTQYIGLFCIQRWLLKEQK